MMKLFNLNRPVTVLLAGLLVLSMPGCQPEGLEMDGKRLQEKHLTIQATFEDIEPETKTVLIDGRVHWVPGDAISLFFGSGTDGGSKFVSDITENALISSFSGTIGAVTGVPETNQDEVMFWGLYPYDPQSDCNGQTISVQIAAMQEGVPETFATNTAPALGRAPGLLLAFRNIYSGLSFVVTESGYHSLTLRSNGGEPIVGRARIGVDADGYPEVQSFVSGSSEVTLKAPSGGFEAGKKYYVLIFPQVLSSGFTLELNSLSQKGTFEISSSQTFKRNVFKNVNNLDTRSTFTARDIVRADFTDEGFADYVFSRYDRDGNGALNMIELENVTSLNVRTEEITSMQGIEFFPNLQELHCYSPYLDWDSGLQQSVGRGILTSLDVSNNPKLRTLSCYNNRITNLDVSHNPLLEYLNVSGNKLESLDLSCNDQLTYLSGSDNNLSELNLSANTALKELYAENNNLTSLDISGNLALERLYFSYNPIENGVDLSSHHNLLALGYSGVGLNGLNLSDFSNLESLSCENCNLTSLDVSHNTSLKDLFCGNNALTRLDLSANTQLSSLGCYGNSLGSLDLSHSPELYYLSCESCGLTSIELSNNAKLQYLYCNYNSLQALNLNQCPMLQSLNCRNNQLQTLDVSENMNLDYLNALNNPMTTLYLTEGQTIANQNLPAGVNFVYKAASGYEINENNFPDAAFRNYVRDNFDRNGDGLLSNSERLSVTYINVMTDTIASLRGIEYFGNLESLNCYGGSVSWDDNNQMVCSGLLTSLDLSGNPALQSLSCGTNRLTALDLSHNTNLTVLYCTYNQLTSLDLSNNTNLSDVYCYNNLLNSLVLPNSSKLRAVECQSNLLTSLDVSHNSALVYLYCGSNQLNSLNLSQNTLLQILNCNYNNLTSLDLGNNTSLTNINARSNPDLSSLVLPSTLQEITGSAFRYCYALTEVLIPASVNNIGNYAFANCTGLTKVTSLNLTPPTVGTNAFYSTNNCPIYVPSTSIASYKSVWSDYADRIVTSASGDNEDISYITW